MYGAGNVAGSIAVPVPGGAIAGGLIKGASTAAKVARGATALGTNLAAQAGVDKLKNVSDTKTLGYDPSKYPKTPQEVMAFQKANGLTPDGKIGPKTGAVLAKMGLTPATVAEDIKAIADRLAMIESGQWRLEEDADYRVWLLENGTVVGEQGEVITDETILSEVNWGELAGDAYKGIKGVAKNFAGGIAGKAQQGTAKSAEEIAAMQAARTAAGKKALSPAQIKNLGLDTAKVTKAQGMANTLGQKIHMNPGKTALGAAALGAGGIAALGGAGASPENTTTGGGGGSGNTPATDTPATDTPATDTPSTDTPAKTGELTPEQKEIIAKMQKIIQGVGATEDEGLLSHIAPANAAIQKATQSVASQSAAKDTTTSKPTDGQAAAPAGSTKIPTQTITVPKVPAGTTVDKTGVTPPVKESAEDELARWLRIARG